MTRQELLDQNEKDFRLELLELLLTAMRAWLADPSYVTYLPVDEVLERLK